jgi:hypothetical protein
VLSSWANLSATGAMARAQGWRAVGDAPGFPQHYYSSTVATETRAVLDLKTELCDWWEAQGVGKQWWWIN